MSHSNKTVINKYSSRLCQPHYLPKDDDTPFSIFDRFNFIDRNIYGAWPQIHQIKMSESNCDLIIEEAFNDLGKFTPPNHSDVGELFDCDCHEQNDDSTTVCLSPMKDERW